MRGLASLVLGSSLLLSGCANSPPSVFYTLSPLPASQTAGALAGGSIAIGLGPVIFPEFLDRPQIVRRGQGNQLAFDEYSRWAGTLQDDFMRVLGENLSYLVGTSRVVIFPTEVRYPLDFRITADVLAFEATPAGDAMLKVRWAILDPFLEQSLGAYETLYRQPIAAPGDDAALISALNATLGTFSEDVAAAVRALPKPVPAPKPAPLY